MDPALLKERSLFKARAAQLPVVEKRKIRDDDASKSRPSKKSRPQPKPASKPPEFDYKRASGSSQYKFGVLAKIVKYMKERHQEGELHPLTIDDILDETQQMDVGQRHKHWLVNEALANNPKIVVVDGDTYKFKPKYDIRDRKSLLRLLYNHDSKGYGGILEDDIVESLPRAQRIFKILGDQIIFVTRPDKKRILFYNDRSCSFNVDEEFQKLWRSATVDGVDEGKIEEHLKKQGITSMQDAGLRKVGPLPKRKGGKRKNKQFKSHNDHMQGVLVDFSSKTAS